MLLAVASVLRILMSVIAGLVADRVPHRKLLVTAGLLVAGAAGAALLGVRTALLTVAGGLLVLGSGWGWTGLVFPSAVRTSPHAPVSAAGIVLTGLATGRDYRTAGVRSADLSCRPFHGLACHHAGPDGGRRHHLNRPSSLRQTHRRGRRDPNRLSMVTRAFRWVDTAAPDVPANPGADSRNCVFGQI